MMITFNQITLLGRLGAKPELRETKSGRPVVTLSVATNRRIRRTAEDGTEAFEERTDWHRVVAWNGWAKRCGQMDKGDGIFVTGRIETRKYDVDGVTRYSTEVQAENVTALEKPKVTELAA